MESTIVRRLWERIEARDWPAAAVLLHEDAVIDWPHSGERIRGGENYVAIQREYPGVWHCTILSIASGPARVAVEVRVDHEAELCFGTGFYEVEAGKIVRGTEYWTTSCAEEPPAWRARWTERMEP